MHTPQTLSHRFAPDPAPGPGRRGLRLLAAAVPLVWAPFVLVHPTTTPFAGPADRLDLWLTVHLAQLVLAPFLAIAVWSLLGPLTGAIANTAKIALALWLSFFSAFDAIAGVAIGRLSQQASHLSDEKRNAVVDALTHLFDHDPFIGGGISVLSMLAQPLWLAVAGSAAFALHRAGAPRITVTTMWLSLLFATHGGPLAALGLLALAVAIATADQVERAHVRKSADPVNG